MNFDSYLSDNTDENSLVDVVISDSSMTLSLPRGLVIINSTVADKEAIIASLQANQDVLILTEGKDAIEEIEAFLSTHNNKYSAVHIVSHGEAGYFTLNGKHFSIENFDASVWANIGQHIAENGDILLYGCDLASVESGRALVQAIADAANVDVAASLDTTGVSGNWDLEFAVGNIETQAISVAGYEHDLAGTLNIVVKETGDSTTNNSTYTLREALAYAESNMANYDGVKITFDASVFNTDTKRIITITQGELQFTSAFSGKEVVIDGAVGDERITVTVETPGLSYNEATGEWVDNADATDSRVFGTPNNTSYSWNITLKNLVLHGGNKKTDYESYKAFGGALYIKGSSVTLNLDKVEISGSKASPTDNNVPTNYWAYGGGIYLYSSGQANLNITNSLIVGNKVAGTIIRENMPISQLYSYGGGIYFYSSSLANIKIESSSISNNVSEAYSKVNFMSGNTSDPKTWSYGGGLYLYTGNSNSIFNIVNSTLSNNTALAKIDMDYNGTGMGWSKTYSYGGAIYESSSMTTRLINSTITGNISRSITIAPYMPYTNYINASPTYGGIYTTSQTIIQNSIILGNYTDKVLSYNSGTLSSNAFNYSDIQSGNIYMAYSIYGSRSGSVQTSVGNYQVTANQANMTSMFESVQEVTTASGNIAYLPVLESDATIHVNEEHAYISKGVLSGYDANGVYYYKNPTTEQWINPQNNSTTTNNITEITRDQVNHYRISANNDGYYLTGAYVSTVPDVVSLVVSTNKDIVFEWDGAISLREALMHATNGTTAEDGTYTITFADTLFKDSNTITIELASTLELTAQLNTVLNGSAFTIDAGNGHTVIVKVPVTYTESLTAGTNASNFRILETTDATKSWNIALKNLELQGGDIAGNGGIVSIVGTNSTVVLNNMTLSDARATNGGALYITGTSNISLSTTNTTFSNNTATSAGGAVYIYNTAETYVTTTISMSNSHLVNNTAGTNGGAVYITTEATTASSNSVTNRTTLNISDTLIESNTATHQGGGVYVQTKGRYATNDIRIENSSFLYNTAEQGGGLYNVTDSTAKTTNTLVILNSTFAQNTATNAGGAVYAINTSINPEAFNYVYALNSTITGNSAGVYGGGVYAYAGNKVYDDLMSNKVYLYNSIVFGNYVGNNSNDVYFATGNNILYYAYSIYGTIASGIDGFNVGTDVANVQYALTNANLTALFDSVTTDAQGRAVAAISGDNRTISIAIGSHAETNGTLVGYKNGVYYFYNRNTNVWQDADGYTIAGNPTATGLSGGTVYSTAQNLLYSGDHASRTLSTTRFFLGATTLAENGLTVTTKDNIINPFDYVISLYEALSYARDGQTAEDGTATITFADNLFTNNTLTLTISSVFSFSFNNKDVTIDGGDNRNVLLKVTTPGRTYNASTGVWTNNSSASAYSIMNFDGQNYSIALKNLSMQGGKASIVKVAGTNVNFTLDTVALYGAYHTSNGGAIYINATNVVTTILNSTISHNQGSLGSAIYVAGTTSNLMYIINSTITSNISSSSSYAIYANTASNTTVTLINSIVYGNYYSTTGRDIYSSNKIVAIHSILGAYSGTLTNTNSTYYSSTNQANMQAVFANVISDGTRYVVKSDGTAPQINTGIAATGGVLVGKLNNTYYYHASDSDNWVGLDNSVVDFDATDQEAYGLENGLVYTIAHNYSNGEHVSRVQSLRVFNIGSYTLTTFETPSLHVTTSSNTINFFDGQLSLKEAWMYLQDDIGVGNLLGADGKYTITFANSVSTITLDAPLTFIDRMSNQEVVIAGASGHIVTLKVATVGRTYSNGVWSDNANASNYRIIEADNNSATWNLTLSYLNLQGGKVSGAGGAIYMNGKNVTLSLNNTTVSSAIATNVETITESTISNSKSYSLYNYGGGIYVNATNNATVTLNNAVVQGNKLETNLNYTLSVTYSTAAQSAEMYAYANVYAYGGGLYVNGTNTTITLQNASKISQNEISTTATVLMNVTYSTSSTTTSTWAWAYPTARVYMYGAGLYASASTKNLATLDNAIIESNTTTSSRSASMGTYTTSNTSTGGKPSAWWNQQYYDWHYGIGAYLSGSSNSTLLITNGSIIRNNAISSTNSTFSGSWSWIYGVGIYASNFIDVTLNNDSSITNNYISQNTTSWQSYGWGIGMYATNITRFTMEDASITANSISFYTNTWYVTTRGVGLYLNASSTVQYTRATISQNSMTSYASWQTWGWGIGVYKEGGGTSYYDNTSITYNSFSTPSTNSWYAWAYGVGIMNNAGTMYLQSNSIVANNTATMKSSPWGHYIYGVGIYTSGILYITDSTITSNSSTTTMNTSGWSTWSYGVGIYSGSLVYLTNATVSYNTAYLNGGSYSSYNYAYGVGLYTQNTATITNSSVTYNQVISTTWYTAVYGIGLYSNNLTLTNSSISYNTLTLNYTSTNQLLSYGIGAYTTGNNVTITNSILHNNTYSATSSISGTMYGAALYSTYAFSSADSTVTRTLHIYNSSIQYNNALDGGALYVHHNNSGGFSVSKNNFILENSMVENNNSSGGIISFWGQASGSGTEVYNVIQVINSTIARNTSAYGAIYMNNPGTGYQEILDNKIYIADSTISGNVTTDSNYAGSIYISSSTTAEYKGISNNYVSFLNSIVYGNYLNTALNDVKFVNSGDTYANAFNSAYSIYATSNVTDSTNVGNLIDPGLNSVFVNTETVSSRLLPVLTQSVTLEGVTHYILKPKTSANNGVAALNGTEVGLDAKGEFYFYNRNTELWQHIITQDVITQTTTYVLDEIEHGRLTDIKSGYTMGSISVVAAVPTLLVTTSKDVIDNEDGLTSLREALISVESDISSGALNLVEADGKTYNIVFHSSVYKAANGTAPIATVTLIDELSLSSVASDYIININGTAGKSLVLDASNINKRVLRIGTSDDSSSNWNISLYNMTLKNGKASADDQGGHGGALFIQGKNINLTLENVTIANSVASGSGGGLYAMVRNDTANVSNRVDIVNSTIYGNSAVYGAGVYIGSYSATGTAKNIVNVMDSTIASNVASTNGGGMYVVSNSSTSVSSNTMYVFNSILFANYTNTTADDATFSGATKLYAVYSVYGTFSEQLYNATDTNLQLATTNDNINKIFQYRYTNANGNYVPYSVNNLTLQITTTTNSAVDNGTLVGKLDDIYYYYNATSGDWENFENNIAYAVNWLDSTSYGLGEITKGKVYTTAENFNTSGEYAPISRLQTTLAFNVGSNGRNIAAPSLVVTTLVDEFNLFDGISLREALEFAANDVNVGNLIGQDGGYTITFNVSFNNSNMATITLPSTLVISSSLSGYSLTIDGGTTSTGVSRLVIINANNHRAFLLGSETDVRSEWNVTFKNMKITGGSAENGAGIYASGKTIDLTLDSSSVVNNTATNQGGGIYAVSTRGTTIRVLNSTIARNTATEGEGGGIYATSDLATNVYLINATVTGNTAGALGGGIYIVSNVATNTVYSYNSILYGNYGYDEETATKIDNDVHYYEGAQFFYSVYSIVGSITGSNEEGESNPTISNRYNVDVSGYTVATGLSKIFSSVSNGYANVNTNGTISLLTSANGIATSDGTRIGIEDETYYYYDKNTGAWTNIVTQATMTGVRTYGFDQVGQGRLDRAADNYYAIGASSNLSATEKKSTVVTTTSDIVDDKDGLVSLREALTYAIAIENYTITFDSAIYDENDTAVIAINNVLSIGNGFSGKNLVIEGIEGKSLVIKVLNTWADYKAGNTNSYSQYRIFQTNTKADCIMNVQL